LVLIVAVAAAASSSGGSARNRAPIAGRSATSAPLPASAGRVPKASSSAAHAVRDVLAYTPVVARGGTRRLAIALTFDDGPSPYTPRLVALLGRLRVPATFFIVGQQLRYFSGALRDELARGFVVGDHTENHAALERLNAAGQFEQIHDDVIRMERIGAPAPILFRPPYGQFNGTTLKLLRRLGMLMVMWSIDPKDWLRPGAKAIVARVLAAARPGSIIELHDGGGDRTQTIAALPAIVIGLRRRHYEFVTVPELLVLDAPPRNQPLPHGRA
jgi:peptidoglycan/xylan/chitin deacetylase (PgdA/CDA1 family)